MEGLLTFILIGALFFFMMRYGCGAHMRHGAHGSHSGHGGQGTDNEIKHTDPVCGMNVDMKQGYGKMHEGTLYRFCSRNCLDKFEADPEKYMNQAAGHTEGGS